MRNVSSKAKKPSILKSLGKYINLLAWSDPKTRPKRWAIEVFFKDAKQMLYLGKEQSKTFDAMVASYSIVMLRYLLLVYIIRKQRIIGPVGPLFREISEEQTFLHMAEKMWAYIKELFIRSSHILSCNIEPDDIIHLIDITEHSLNNLIRV